MKNFLLLCFALISYSISIYPQTNTFTFQTAYPSGQNLVETVNSVTLTVSSPGTPVDLTDYGGWGGTSGDVAYNNTSVSSVVLTFNKSVSINSLQFADGFNNVGSPFHLLFTPTPNTGTIGAAIPANDGAKVIFDGHFTNITAITITSTDLPSFYYLIDNIEMSSALPVELTSFNVIPSDNSVKLEWQTATEINNLGFDIERQSFSEQQIAGNWEKIGFVKGNGNSNSPKAYSFVDNTPASGKLRYRLKQNDNDGNFKYYDPVTVTINAPHEFKLLQNSPNPFNPATAIRFQLPVNSFVSVKIFDLIGREITTLVNEEKPAGSHVVYWNGKDSRGLAVPSGVYLYRLSAGNYVETRKMNLLK